MEEELHLRVFSARSELHADDEGAETFLEGSPSGEAMARNRAIAEALEDGFLLDQIRLCKESPESLEIEQLDESDQALIKELASAVTSQVGRALVGLTVLQLAIKTICPDQSVRLHKAGAGGSGFSWVEGISMRSLDRNYITPALRKHDLLRLNRDGFMMTRSLAENYPYTSVYKAAIRGAKTQWLEIVERVERGRLPAKAGLQHLLSQLINRAEGLLRLADEALAQLTEVLDSATLSEDSARDLIWAHVEQSEYPARLMEVAMHSLLQALEEQGCLGDLELEPLSQMRSANKKHGNVGDVELFEMRQIVEAWDAKYGKAYLREELEELDEKLAEHPAVNVAGFVFSGELDRESELLARAAELEEVHGASIRFLGFPQWVQEQFRRCPDAEVEVADAWLAAYTESLAQKRPEKAPIDEPTFEWLREWVGVLEHADLSEKG